VIAAALRHLPSLLGVIAGIYLMQNPVLGRAWAAPVLAFGVLLVARWAGLRCFDRRPAMARWLIEPWSMSQIAVVTLATQAILWITGAAPSLLGMSVADDASKYLVGAVTAFVSAAWTKEIGESKGPFLTSTQFQTAAKSFSLHHKLTNKNPKEFNACENELDTPGWEFEERGARAAILEAYMRSKR
jgi:hypothetical protein